MIQLVDLDVQYQSIKTEVLSEIQKVIESKEFIQGRFVENFCKNFSESQGVKYSIGCSNGTSAITVALRALDIGTGDEVITVNNSFLPLLRQFAKLELSLFLLIAIAKLIKLMSLKSKQR